MLSVFFASDTEGVEGKRRILKKLKSLEEENLRLKKVYSELALGHQLAKEIIVKKI